VPSLAASQNEMLMRAATVAQVLQDWFYFTCDRNFTEVIESVDVDIQVPGGLESV